MSTTNYYLKQRCGLGEPLHIGKSYSRGKRLYPGFILHVWDGDGYEPRPDWIRAPESLSDWNILILDPHHIITDSDANVMDHQEMMSIMCGPYTDRQTGEFS